MKREIMLDRDYLKIPVIRNGKLTEVSFKIGAEKIWQFCIPVQTEDMGIQTGKYAELCVREWKGKTMVLETEKEDPLSKEILLSDERSEKEGDRYPKIHFTPVSGWMNDPNGLCFYQGQYHLFFQHNMFDTEWNNMSWGHAVSDDLLHWTQLEEALLPDEEGVMYSGSAVVNVRGEEICPKDAMLLFYTCAGGRSEWSCGRAFTQKAAYSVDGRTFHKKQEVLIPHIVDENRDPKVGWHERSQRYYMVLFLTGHEYAIFSSKDLKNWTQTQRIEIPESWECPDLMRVDCEDGSEKWIFWTADGYYLVGEFDGTEFTTTQEARRLYGNEVPYAAQSFWGCGRVIQIPWLRLRWENQPYQGAMGIPRELELIRKDGEDILAAHLPKELWGQRTEVWAGVPDQKKSMEAAADGCYVISVEKEQKCSFSVCFGTEAVSWDEEKKILRMAGQEFLLEDVSDVMIVWDYDILEVSCNRDTVYFCCRTETCPKKEILLTGNVYMEVGVV